MTEEGLWSGDGGDALVEEGEWEDGLMDRFQQLEWCFPWGHGAKTPRFVARDVGK